jgi:hypothetical protein
MPTHPHTHTHTETQRACNRTRNHRAQRDDLSMIAVLSSHSDFSLSFDFLAGIIFDFIYFLTVSLRRQLAEVEIALETANDKK